MHGVASSSDDSPTHQELRPGTLASVVPERLLSSKPILIITLFPSCCPILCSMLPPSLPVRNPYAACRRPTDKKYDAASRVAIDGVFLIRVKRWLCSTLSCFNCLSTCTSSAAHVIFAQLIVECRIGPRPAAGEWVASVTDTSKNYKVPVRSSLVQRDQLCLYTLVDRDG